MTLTYRVQEGVDPKLDFAKKIIMESDLSDLSYLYRFGAYISPEEEDSGVLKQPAGGRDQEDGRYLY